MGAHFTSGRMKLQMVALVLALILLIVDHASPLAWVVAATAIISWAAKRVALYQEHQMQLDREGK